MAGGGWGAYEDQDNGHHRGLCGLGKHSDEKFEAWTPRYHAQMSRYRNNTVAIGDVEVHIQSAVPVRLRHDLLTRPRTVRKCPPALRRRDEIALWEGTATGRQREPAFFSARGAPFLAAVIGCKHACITPAPLHWKVLQNISRCAWVPYLLPASLPACLSRYLLLALVMVLGLVHTKVRRYPYPDPMLASTPSPPLILPMQHLMLTWSPWAGPDIASCPLLHITSYSGFITDGCPDFYGSFPSAYRWRGITGRLYMVQMRLRWSTAEQIHVRIASCCHQARQITKLLDRL